MRPLYLLTVLLGLMSASTPSFGAFDLTGLSINVEDAHFYYYEDPTSKQEIVYNNKDSLAASSLKKQVNTVIIISGFQSEGSTPSSQTTKDGFFTTKRQQNIIIVDWGKLSGAEMKLDGVIAAAKAYQAVLVNVDTLGERVADFIHFLQTDADSPPNKVEIVGFSLGAQVAGAAGFWFNKKYGQRISRITGLDPAGPTFSKQTNMQKRIDKSDADFVAIYHTNRGSLGDSAQQTGHINVFVNGGVKQPGCGQTDSSSPSEGLECSHAYAWKLFNACFTQTFTACPCSAIQCQCKDCNLTCTDPITLGYATSPSSRGVYYVKTGTLQ